MPTASSPATGPFTYIGAVAFGGAGAASAGRLRLMQTAPGTYPAGGDINGEGTAAVAVSITSATGPVAGWFLL